MLCLLITSGFGACSDSGRFGPTNLLQAGSMGSALPVAQGNHLYQSQDFLSFQYSKSKLISLLVFVEYWIRTGRDFHFSSALQVDKISQGACCLGKCLPLLVGLISQQVIFPSPVMVLFIRMAVFLLAHPQTELQREN